MARFTNPRQFLQNVDISSELNNTITDALNDFKIDDIAKGFSEATTYIEQLDITPASLESLNINVEQAIDDFALPSLPGLSMGELDNLPTSFLPKMPSLPGLGNSNFDLFSSTGNTGNAQASLPLPNGLRNYTHYNYIITLAVLTDEELNLPNQTIRQRPPENIVMRSTGGAGDAKALTAFEINGNKIEFFIDDVEIKSVVAPNSKSRHTSATHITCQVTEPYSMGLLPQALELACVGADQGNYLEAPMALIIEFQGYDSNGNLYDVPDSRRVISCRWVGGEFQAGQRGSVYDLTLVPYNEMAFTDVVQNIPVDISVSGRNMNEMLQTGFRSLASNVNTHLLENKENTYVHEQDEYIFIFPKDRATFETVLEQGVRDQGATVSPNQSNSRNYDIDEALASIHNGITLKQDRRIVETLFEEQSGFTLKRSNLSETIKQYNENPANVNDIGNSSINISDPLGPGSNPYIQTNFVHDAEENIFTRDNITIDPQKREIKFKQGEKIQRIIEELVCISDLGDDIGSFATPDANGMVPWFRVESQVFNVKNTKQEAQSGRSPRIYVFRVVPYKVHHSVFAAPNQAYKGYDSLRSQAAKEYNYIYTGKNEDVLDFNLQFKNVFYAALAPDGNNGAANTGSQTASTPDDGLRGTARDVGAGNKSESPATAERDPNSGAGPSAGGVAEDVSVRTARRFNDAIVNSDTDLISASMEIWGDPFWLSDSGMGNYVARETNLFNVNSDKQADYQNGQNDIIINFRTPVDIRDNGTYSFPQEFVDVDNFSGLYMVTTLTNSFRMGKFTQELNLVRRRNQRLADRATDENASLIEFQQVPERLLAELQNAGATPDQVQDLINRNIQQFGTINVQDLVSNIPGIDDIQGKVSSIFNNIGLDQLELDQALGKFNNLQAEFDSALGELTDIQGQLQGAISGATQQVEGLIGEATTALNTATGEAQNAINNITGGIA